MSRNELQSPPNGVEKPEIAGNQATLKLLFYGRLLKTLDDPSRQYALYAKRNNSPEPFPYLKERAKLALEDLYFGRDNPDFIEQFRRDWGGDAEFLESRFRNAFPTIDKAKKELLGTDKKISLKDKMTAAFLLGGTLSSESVTPEQKEHILTLAGYNPEEAKKIIGKIGLSFGLTAIASSVYSAGASVGAGYGYVFPFVNDIHNPGTQVALGLSFISHYTTLGLNTRQSVRLVEHPFVGTSANAVATATYYLLEKMMPIKTKKREAINIVLSVLPFLGIEVAVNLGLGALDQPSAIVTKNIALSVMNLIESGGVEAFLRIKDRKKGS